MRMASDGLARAQFVFKVAAWTMSACVTMLGCAPGLAVIPPPDQPPPESPVSQVDVERWERASEIFARNDASGEWDGDACHETLAAFERVAGAQDRARAVYMSGLVAERCGNPESARSLFTRALRLEPGLCEAQVGLAVMDLEQGRDGDARERFEIAVREDNRCAPAYVNLATLQARNPGEREAAIANLRRALAVRSDYLPALNQMARIYLAWSEDRAEMLPLAEVVCRQAQLLDADYAPIYNTWALIDLAQGDLTAAAAKLHRAVTIDPSFYEAWMNFGQLTLSQRAYTDAARAFTRARELRPSSYDAVIGLGVAMRGLSQPEEAEASYRAALALDDDRAEAYFDLAVLYHEHREGTVEQLRQALEMLGEFVQRAQGETELSETIQATLRWCGETTARRRSACRPGRAEVITRSLDLLGHPVDRPQWTRN